MKEIKLSISKYGQFFTKVDDEDFEYLNQFKWYPLKKRDNYYAVRGNYVGKINGKYKTIMVRMSRLIMNINDPKILIDHEDHDTLNNQKNNLRKCNTSQNCSNQRPAKGKTSAYLGVSWHKKNKKWEASAGNNGKKIYIGIFETEVEAAIAYNQRATELHAEFANLNKICAS